MKVLLLAFAMFFVMTSTVFAQDEPTVFRPWHKVYLPVVITSQTEVPVVVDPEPLPKVYTNADAALYSFSVQPAFNFDYEYSEVDDSTYSQVSHWYTRSYVDLSNNDLNTMVLFFFGIAENEEQAIAANLEWQDHKPMLQGYPDSSVQGCWSFVLLGQNVYSCSIGYNVGNLVVRVSTVVDANHSMFDWHELHVSSSRTAVEGSVIASANIVSVSVDNNLIKTFAEQIDR